MIEKIGHYSLTHPASIYDEEALTALELAGRTAGKVNEVVEGFNSLEKETHERLDKQEQKQIPETVTAEVQKQIDNGTFDEQIDESIGNLKDRMDHLLGSIPEGPTSGDAEIIDARLGVGAIAYENLGEALRLQFGAILGTPLDLTHYTDNYFIRMTGQKATGNGFRCSAAIKLNKTDLYITGATKKYSSAYILNFYSMDILNQFHFIGGWNPSNGGLCEKVNIPSGAEFVAVNYGLDIWDDLTLYETGMVRDEAQKTSVTRIMSKLIMHDTEAEPLTVKLIGDSITHGYGGTGFTNDADHGEEIFPDYYVNTSGHCWANSLRDYLQSKFNCIVKNYGTTGRDADNLVTHLDDLIEDGDNIVICSIGTNDRPEGNSSAWGGTKTPETIYRSLNAIYAGCKKRGKEIIFVTPIPCSEEMEEGRPRHTEDIAHIIRKVSEDCHTEHIPMHDLFNDYLDTTGTPLDQLLKDGLHPNDIGYDLMFRLISKSLGITPKANITE